MAANSASELLEIVLNMQAFERVVSHSKPTSLLKGLMGRNILEKKNKEMRSQSSLHQSYSSAPMAVIPSRLSEGSKPFAELNISQMSESIIVDLSPPSNHIVPLIFSSLSVDNGSDQENQPPIHNSAYDVKNRTAFKD